MIILYIVILVGMFCTLVLITSALYFQLGLFSRFYHDILGWHTPNIKKGIVFDGCSMRGICKHCKQPIIQDSQGNWFVEDDYVR